MSLHREIEIEPLSDARMSKIKRAVFEKLENEEPSELIGVPARSSRRVGWPAYMAAAIAAAALLVVGLTWRTWHPQHQSFADSPTRIVTDASDSHLALGESSVDVGRGSVLLVNGDDDRGVLLVLERGSVVCEVAPRMGRPPFVVQAGAVRVRVVGTHFTVTRVEDSARVDVAHGTVEVSEGGRTALVHDGESWGPTLAAQTLSPAAPSPAALSLTPSPLVASALATVRAPINDARRAKRIPAALVTDSASRPVPSLPTAEPISETPSEAPPAVAPVAATAAPTVGAAAEAPRPPVVRPQPAAGDSDGSDQQLFEQATKVERQDPSRALAIYGRLAAGSGPWAANALFAQGRLEGDRGHTAESRQLLSAYVVRYPRGRNAADARLLLDRLK